MIHRLGRDRLVCVKLPRRVLTVSGSIPRQKGREERLLGRCDGTGFQDRVVKEGVRVSCRGQRVSGDLVSFVGHIYNNGQITFNQ